MKVTRHNASKSWSKHRLDPTLTMSPAAVYHGCVPSTLNRRGRVSSFVFQELHFFPSTPFQHTSSARQVLRVSRESAPVIQCRTNSLHFLCCQSACRTRLSTRDSCSHPDITVSQTHGNPITTFQCALDSELHRKSEKIEMLFIIQVCETDRYGKSV